MDNHDLTSYEQLVCSPDEEETVNGKNEGDYNLEVPEPRPPQQGRYQIG